MKKLIKAKLIAQTTGSMIASTVVIIEPKNSKDATIKTSHFKNT